MVTVYRCNNGTVIIHREKSFIEKVPLIFDLIHISMIFVDDQVVSTAINNIFLPISGILRKGDIDG